MSRLEQDEQPRVDLESPHPRAGPPQHNQLVLGIAGPSDSLAGSQDRFVRTLWPISGQVPRYVTAADRPRPQIAPGAACGERYSPATQGLTVVAGSAETAGLGALRKEPASRCAHPVLGPRRGFVSCSNCPPREAGRGFQSPCGDGFVATGGVCWVCPPAGQPTGAGPLGLGCRQSARRSEPVGYR